MFYPALYYFKMLWNDSKENRKHFAKAYKCYSKTSVILYFIYVLLIVIILLVAIFQDPSDTSFYTSMATIVGVYIVFLFLVGHFVKVVQEYANRMDQGDHVKA